MSIKKMDEKSLDYIVKQMITTVDKSKNEIYTIGEQSRNDYEALVKELEEIKAEVKKTIEYGDYTQLSLPTILSV